MIGIIPGWAGVARLLVKGGLTNTEYMTKTAREVSALDLKAIGVFNEVVDIAFPFPKRQQTDDADSDRKRFFEALEEHDDKTGMMLLPKGLEMAICPQEEIPEIRAGDRDLLATREATAQEVLRRSVPENYAHIRGKPLMEVQGDLSKLGRPLAPQSIRALDSLFGDFEASPFDEEAFVEKELEADAALYRDQRFLEGLTAMLGRRVPDFSAQDEPPDAEGVFQDAGLVQSF
jgi:enoyl-CoA hydratase/carnithine racemase